MLTVVLSLANLTSCTTQRLIENQKSTTENHESRTENHESRIENRESLIDSIHILTTETLWLPPDTLGRQYPLKTTIRETGKQTKTQTNQTIHQNDTIYITTSNHQSSTLNHEPLTLNHEPLTLNHEPLTLNHEPLTLNQKTNHWLPWLIIVGMVIIAIILLAIRIFL